MGMLLRRHRKPKQEEVKVEPKKAPKAKNKKASEKE